MNKIIGACGKHPGQSMINCPVCAAESFKKLDGIKTNKETKEEIAELIKDLNDEQAGDVLYFMATIIAKRKKISPVVLLNLVNNWQHVEKLIYLLNNKT